MRTTEYETAYCELIAKVVRSAMAAHPLLGMIPVHVTRHETGHRSIVSGDTHDFPGIESEMTGVFDLDSVRRGRVLTHDEMVRSLAAQHCDTLERRLLEDICFITDATGQVVDAKGQPIGIDHLIDLLEAVPWRFHEDGMVDRDGFAFVLSPELGERLRGLEETDGHRDRLRQIEQRKREEWAASQRTRRLTGRGRA